MKDYIPVVIKVIPQDNFHVHVTFDNGKVIVYDVTKDLQTKLFKPLRDIKVFKETCTIMNDTLAWDITGSSDTGNCIDIDLFTLYEMECISEKE